MKRVALLIFNILNTVFVYSQQPEELFKDISSKAKDASVVVEYSFSAVYDGNAMVHTGSVEVQDDMWILKGGRIEIYTSGEATWVLDVDSKEAIVEPAWTYDDLMSFYSSSVDSGIMPEIDVISIVTADKKRPSYFTPVLGEEWIITDLR